MGLQFWLHTEHIEQIHNEILDIASKDIWIIFITNEKRSTSPEQKIIAIAHVPRSSSLTTQRVCVANLCCKVMALHVLHKWG